MYIDENWQALSIIPQFCQWLLIIVNIELEKCSAHVQNLKNRYLRHIGNEGSYVTYIRCICTLYIHTYIHIMLHI